MQCKSNNTGLPDKLKSGMEAISGLSLADIKVNYNSFEPAKSGAHVYAQGHQIHLGTGQEKHLPHELGHAVQQKQGRVTATRQMKSGAQINDNAELEREADIPGVRTLAAGA